MGKRSKYRVLLVDDDKDILSLLKYNLEREGYQVRTNYRSVETISVARRFNPDLIILDIMMPGQNGIEICKELRSDDKFKNTYIFFLTAKSDNYLQVAAFETGGDDYIEKITGLRALNYKISSVLKENLVIRKREKIIRIGNMILDRGDLSITSGSRKVFLPKFEFELLFFFAQNPKTTISKDLLLHNIWGSEVYLVARSIESYVDNIRGKLGKEIIKKDEEGGFRLIA